MSVASPDVPPAPYPRWRYLLAAYVIVHAIAWAWIPSLAGRQPPVDNFEQLSWAEHPAWGYDKHPPLPTMVLWLFERMAPAGLPLTYALGGLEIIALLFLTWWITRQVLDERRAVVAVLLVSSVTYYTNRLHFYNHNTALLVAYALSVACVFKAAQTKRLVWYALLGVSWATGLLSKYQMVIGIACNVSFLLWIGRRRPLEQVARLAVAAVVCAALLVPHVSWLIEHGFPSFAYAARWIFARLHWWQRPVDVAGFLLDQAMRVAPLAAWLFLLTRLPAGRRAEQPPVIFRDASALAAPLLSIHSWGALALMSSLPVLLGTNLEMHWGTAFVWTLPVVFLRTRAGMRLAALPLKTFAVAIVLLQIVMLAVYR